MALQLKTKTMRKEETDKQTRKYEKALRLIFAKEKCEIQNTKWMRKLRRASESRRRAPKERQEREVALSLSLLSHASPTLFGSARETFRFLFFSFLLILNAVFFIICLFVSLFVVLCFVCFSFFFRFCLIFAFVFDFVVVVDVFCCCNNNS